MSLETAEWLNTQTLIGMGHNAWHRDDSAMGEESNHYPGAIPAADVARRLFSWQAEASPLMAMTSAGITQVTGHVANTRSDTGAILGIVSDKYAIHQHAETLLAGAERITGSGLGISSAGLLKGGAVAWVAVSLADTTITPEGVEFAQYLMCYGSHDGSLSTGFRDVTTNVVCDNTMSAALGEDASRINVRVRHTSNSVARVATAQDALHRIMHRSDAFAAQVAELCATEVTARQWAEIVARLAPMPKDGESKTSRGVTMAETKRDALKSLWANDARCAPWAGTGWGVIQTANTYAHHLQSVRGASRGERNMLATLSGDWDTLDAATSAVLTRVLATV